MDRIIRIWKGLKDAGIPEVMLYLPDGSASRCNWDDTVMIGSLRVALLGDQDRGIVRLMPIESCTGIGIPSPKGTDPMMYRGVVRQKIADAISVAPEQTEISSDSDSETFRTESTPSQPIPEINETKSILDSLERNRSEPLPIMTAG